MSNNKGGNAPLAVITLDDPITMGQEVTREIHLIKKPTLEDMDGLPLDGSLDSSGVALLLGRISNLATPTCKKITLTDIVKLMKVLRPFLPSGQVIGG